MAKQPTGWNDRLVIENGKVTRIVRAEYCKGYYDIEIDVYKENEDGECWHRNCYCSMWGGYVVCFPGLPINTNPYSYFYDSSLAFEEDWKECTRMSIGRSRTFISPEEKGAVIMNNFDFKYIFKKYNFEDLSEVMEVLQQWKKHPEIEMMLAAGFKNLAMNNSLYRMKAENRKKIMNFCRQNSFAKNMRLKDILLCIKSPDPSFMAHYLTDVSSWMRTEITPDTYTYICRKGLNNSEGIVLYRDYMYMLRNSTHNPDDPYWRYPSDFDTKHAQLVEERRIAEEFLKQKHEQEKAKRQKKFEKVVRKYSKYNGQSEGYDIFFTASAQEWDLQAKTLHQCIVYANYKDQVTDRKCLLAFIRKDGKPIATAQIMPGHKINQFYGDEIDRNNCAPSEEVKKAFYSWFDKVLIREVI